jgi:hypothetical protein
MAIEAHTAAANASAVPQASKPTPTSEPEMAAEALPMGQDITDTWAEAADETGTVKSTKQMPEPDSRGG